MLFLGIDVSKDKLDGAAVSEGTGAVLGRRSVPNTPDGVARLRCWAETIEQPDVWTFGSGVVRYPSCPS